MTATAGEKSVLESKAISNPVLQAYLAWRRSLMIFVLVMTALSAGLATWRDYYDESESMDFFETLIKQVSKKTGVPVQALLPAAAEAADAVKEEADAENADETAASTESKASDAAEDEKKTVLSKLDEIVNLVALYILPVAALAVVMFWTQFQFTYRILVAAFLFSFFAPMLILFCPWSWWDVTPATATTNSKSVQWEQLADGLVIALSYLTTLLPTVLSLVPGVQKACVRVKTLLPQSTLPGWFLVSVAPFYGLFLLVVAIAINQIVTSAFVMIGVLLIIGSSMIYAFKLSVFTRPLESPEDFRRLLLVQKTAGMMTLVAGGLFFAFIMTHDLLGIHLFGLDPKTSVLQPLDIAEFVLEILSRSMFMTVFGADLFVQMSLVAWQNEQRFKGTPAAAQYDDVMSAMGATA